MPTKRTDVTVGEVFEWFKKTIAVNYQHRSRVESFRKYRLFCAKFGDRLVRDCKPSHLIEFIDLMPLVRTEAARRTWINVIERPFNAAVDAKIIELNPLRDAAQLKDHRNRTVTNDEFRALMRRESAAFRRVLIFLRYAGARPCEVLLIKGAHVDASGRFILLRQQNRSWPSRTTRKIELRQDSVAHKLIRYLLTRTKPGEYLFRTRNNKPWARRSLTKRLFLARKHGRVPVNTRLFSPECSRVAIDSG